MLHGLGNRFHHWEDEHGGQKKRKDSRSDAENCGAHQTAPPHAPQFRRSPQKSQRRRVKRSLWMAVEQNHHERHGERRHRAAADNAPHAGQHQGKPERRGRHLPFQPEGEECGEHPRRRADQRRRLAALQIAQEDEHQQPGQEKGDRGQIGQAVRHRQQQRGEEERFVGSRLCGGGENVSAENVRVPQRPFAVCVRLAHRVLPRNVLAVDVGQHTVVTRAHAV